MLRAVRKKPRRRSEIKDYPRHAEVERGSLDPNSALTKMAALVGKNKSVLDVGCASGYLAKLLSTRRNDVTGVDINPAALDEARAFCSSVHAVDLDEVALPEVLGEARFDAVVFGDVLEHLRNPGWVLDETRRLLNEDGFVVASIPNVAHGAVRLAFVKGAFDYGELGILDDTHLRFFTIKTIEELFLQAGYQIEQVERTTLPIFGESDLVPRVTREDYPETLVAEIEADPDSTTLQFVIKAVPLSDAGKLQAITKKFLSANAELIAGRAAAARHASENRRLQHELEATQATLKTTHEEMLRAQQSFQAAQAAGGGGPELAALREELEAERLKLRSTQATLQVTHDEMLAAQESQAHAASAETAARLAAAERYEAEISSLRQGLEASRTAQESQAYAASAETAARVAAAERYEAEIASLRQGLEASQAALESAQTAGKNVQEELQAAQNYARERERRTAELETMLLELEQSTFAAEQVARRHELKSGALREELETTHALLASTRATLKNTHAEMLQAQQRFEDAQESHRALLASTRATLKNTHAEMLQAQQRFEDAQEANEASRSELESELASARTTLKTTHEEMLQAQQRFADAQSALSQTKASLQTADQEMRQAQVNFEGANARAEESEARARESVVRAQEIAARAQQSEARAQEIETAAAAALEQFQTQLHQTNAELEQEREALQRWATAYRELEQRLVAQAETAIAKAQAEIDEVAQLTQAIQNSPFWSLKLALSAVREAVRKFVRRFSLQPQRR
jgi:2-polyprenyl-3-methyl-5-hydroxy-6-metoxy-1,4-benzoquinol methylase/DNA polymerase III delta prime subunit